MTSSSYCTWEQWLDGWQIPPLQFPWKSTKAGPVWKLWGNRGRKLRGRGERKAVFSIITQYHPQAGSCPHCSHGLWHFGEAAGNNIFSQSTGLENSGFARMIGFSGSCLFCMWKYVCIHRCVVVKNDKIDLYINVEVFKARLDGVWDNLGTVESVSACGRGWNWMSFWVPNRSGVY